MANGRVEGIYIAPDKGAPMQRFETATLLWNRGIEGDRYCAGRGSFPGKRHVTIINHRFIAGTPWEHIHRRNLVISGIELMYAFGREHHALIRIGENVRLKLIKYCDPCERPGKLSGVLGMKKALQDCGGVIAQVIIGGVIRVGDEVIVKPKGY